MSDRALALLVDLGPLAVEPLVAALSRAKEARRRSLIIAALGAIGRRHPSAAITAALVRVAKRDCDPSIRVQAAAVATDLVAGTFRPYPDLRR